MRDYISCVHLFSSVCMSLDHYVALFSLRLRSLTGEVFWCCCCVEFLRCFCVCLLFIFFRLKIAKKDNWSSVHTIQNTLRYFEILLNLNLINQILALGCRVFAGINIASIIDAIIIEECILPELNVYFWLMMLPLILRWLLLLSDIKFRATLATIYHPSIYPDFQIQHIICTFLPTSAW